MSPSPEPPYFTDAIPLYKDPVPISGFITPHKCGASQVTKSPPTSSVGTPSSMTKRYTIRPYCGPIAEEATEEPESDAPVPTTPIPEPCIVIGHRLSERIAVPKSAGVLCAVVRACCMRYMHLYYNYPDLQYWFPEGFTSYRDCMKCNHPCLPMRGSFTSILGCS